MAKLTKDQKRKTKLTVRNKKLLIKPVKLKLKEVRSSFSLSKVILNKETGTEENIDYQINAAQADILVNQERLCDGRIVEIKPKYKPLVTAWDYFGIAAINYFHASFEECDRLIVPITPNELEGVVVAFPDYDDKADFDTDRILVHTELDSSFNFADNKSVGSFEVWFNKEIVPFLRDMPNIERINEDYKMRSFHIFKAFDKYWCGAYLVPKSQLKSFEKRTHKKLDYMHGESFDSETYVNRFENRH